MKIIDFFAGSPSPMALALGFFDSVHIGHRALIAAARTEAEKIGASLAVFTFRNNPYPQLAPNRGGEVLDFLERTEEFAALGAAFTVAAEFDENFRNMPREEFLRVLTRRYRLDRLVVGSDYRFGRGGEGDVGYLSEALSALGYPPPLVVDFVTENGEKVSTGSIAGLLERGEIQLANRLLAAPFRVSGRVLEGYRVGRTLGFPTANLAYPPGKVRLKPGVYLCAATAQGREYPAIANVGGRPTFGDGEAKVECHLDGYSGNLYGARITVRFHRRLRDTLAFASPRELAGQLKRDLQALQAWKGGTI